MTRDEEILTACKSFLSRYPSIDQAGLSIGFLDGAVWADKHPVNVYHDASEEPIYKHGILYQDKLGIVYFTTKSDAIALHGNWETFVEVTLMIRWAYIDDLLPKKFGNSERLKGEHNGNND